MGKSVKAEYYTMDEVCRILKLCRPTVKRALARGELEAFKVGRQYRFPKDGIRKCLDTLAKVRDN